MSRPRQTDLCGLLRHEAAGRDRLPGRLSLPCQRSRASGCRARPPAAARRRDARPVRARLQRAPVAALLSDRTFLVGYEPPELQPSIDDDVAEAATALAATFETASRGVIYEHRPASLPAERLLAALKPALAEAGRGLRLGVRARRRGRAPARRGSRPGDARRRSRQRRAFLDLLGRTIRTGDAPDAGGASRPRVRR